MLCDALGLPVKFIVTAGQDGDAPQAIPLLLGEKPHYVLADKAYDSDEIVAHLANAGVAVLIPPKSNRKIHREYDKELYKERNVIERLFSRLKQFRKLATRYEKSKINFEALIYLACSFLWLI